MEWESRDGEGRGWMMSRVGQRARERSDGNNAMYFFRGRGEVGVATLTARGVHREPKRRRGCRAAQGRREARKVNVSEAAWPAYVPSYTACVRKPVP